MSQYVTENNCITNLVLAEAGDERVGLLPPAPSSPLLLLDARRRHPPPDHINLRGSFTYDIRNVF